MDLISTAGLASAAKAADAASAEGAKVAGLRAHETREYVDRAFQDGAIQTGGPAITRVLPPVSRFSAEGGHGETKQRVLDKLGDFFERFFGLSSNGGND